MKLLTPDFDCTSNASVCDMTNSATSAVECDSRGMPSRIMLNNLNIQGYQLPLIRLLPQPVISNLLTLDLSYDFYTGSIPPAYMYLSSLRGLSLGHNFLSGSIPSYFGLFTNIGTGEASRAIDGLLDVGGNSLTGTLPPELGNLQSMNRFSADSNSLKGSIPDSYGDMLGLTGLYLNSNRLTGTIPMSMSQLTMMTELHLYGNLLSGTIPEIFEGYLSVREVLLQHNTLVGTIPSSLYGCTGLVSIDISYNKLSGSLPSVLCSLPLTKLHVAGNDGLTCYASCLSSILINRNASIDFEYLPACSESPTSSPSTLRPSASFSPSDLSPIFSPSPSNKAPPSYSPNTYSEGNHLIAYINSF